MALCNLLAFWTGGEQTRMDSLFRQSGLLRDKWDDVHYADGSTYGEKTIERAVGNTSAFYDPEPKKEQTRDSASTRDSSADAGRDEAKRSHAYLTEKNRLLAERVEELETLLEWKNERIRELEAEVEQFEVAIKECEQEIDELCERQADSVSDEDAESEESSVLERTKNWFGGDRE